MKVIGLLIFGSMACGAFAAQPWTFSDCVDYARANNITLQKSRLAEQTAAVNLQEAKGAWQPTLDFATGHSFMNAPWGRGSKNTYNSSYGLNAGWTVYDGGTRTNTIKRDEVALDIERLATDEEARTIETDLLQVYLNILYARESIDICRRAEQLSGAQADRARQLMEAGRLSRVDYARLNSQWEQDKYATVSAEGTYESRRMELKQLLELGLDTTLTVADVQWTREQTLAALPDMAESLDLAYTTDVRLQSLMAARELSDYDPELAKAGKRPHISLSGSVGTGYAAPGNAFGNALKNNWNEQLGVQLTLPIFDGLKTKSAEQRARIGQIDADLDIERRRTELAGLVENWFIDTRTAQARYVAAAEQLESAQLTDELTNEQFSLGYVNTVELMDAHNAYTEAQHALLQAKYMAMLGRTMIGYYRSGSVTL